MILCQSDLKLNDSVVTHSCYSRKHGALCTGPKENRRQGLRAPLAAGVAFIPASGYCGNKHEGRGRTNSRGTARCRNETPPPHDPACSRRSRSMWPLQLGFLQAMSSFSVSGHPAGSRPCYRYNMEANSHTLKPSVSIIN